MLSKSTKVGSYENYNVYIKGEKTKQKHPGNQSEK